MKKPNRAAYAASVWAFLFAAMSFYWAMGGVEGVETLGSQIRTLALERSLWFVFILWITGALKAIAGILALALARWSGKMIPRWMLLVAGWAAGVFLTLYGGLNLAVRGLMAIGMIETPESMYSAAARWHLLFWDPWWLLGGILFLAAVWHFQRSSRIRRLPVQSA